MTTSKHPCASTDEADRIVETLMRDTEQARKVQSMLRDRLAVAPQAANPPATYDSVDDMWDNVPV